MPFTFRNSQVKVNLHHHSQTYFLRQNPSRHLVSFAVPHCLKIVKNQKVLFLPLVLDDLEIQLAYANQGLLQINQESIVTFKVIWVIWVSI